jgi:signal transduction histidine kinase
MKTLLRTLCLLCLLFQGKTTAQNNFSLSQNGVPVLQLTEHPKDSIHLRPYMNVFVDSGRLKTFQEVQNQVFSPLSKMQMGHQLDSYFHFWYHFRVKNPSPDTLKLSLSFLEIHTLTAYTMQDARLLDSVTVGKLIRPHPQPEKTDYPSNRTLLLYFPPNSEVTVWLKATKSWCTVAEQPTLCNPSVEARFHYKTLLGVYAWNFTFLGVLLFMMIHALTHFLLQKQAAFLYYFLYILSHFAFYWWAFEREDQLLHNIPTLFFTEPYRLPLASAWSFFYFLFIDKFFDAKHTMPKLHRWFLVSMWAFLVLILADVLVISFDGVLAYQFIYILKCFFTFGGLLLSIYLLWAFKKSPLTKYILIGSLLFVIGTIPVRVIPDTSFYWEDSLVWQQIGIILELIFFSVALAYKARLDTISKEQLAVANQQLTFQNTVNMLEKERLMLEIAKKETQVRTEVALDIHDKVGAGLSKMSLTAQSDSSRQDAEVPYLQERIRYFGNEARLLASKMREIIFAIDPDYNNFADMQAYFREQAREYWTHLNVIVIFDFESACNSEDTPVSTNLKRHLLPIFAEAQNNVAKYAETKKVYLTFKFLSPSSDFHERSPQYILEIRDEGIGFDLNDIEQNHSQIKGISGMKHRAEMLDAVCTIESLVGKGTVVRVVGSI